MKQLIHLFIISILICTESGAQEYSYIQYTEKDGLPSSTVYDLAQDKDGFMWFATENGVCRFDGTNFKTFTTKDGLPDNAVLKLHIEKTGRIWAIPFMYCPYYLKNDKFYPIDATDSMRKLLSSTYIMESSQTKLFFISATQTYVQYEKNKIVPIQNYRPGLSSGLASILAIDDSTLIVGKTDSTFMLNGSKSNFLHKAGLFREMTWLNDEKKNN
jgi:Two component regulator propeller